MKLDVMKTIENMRGKINERYDASLRDFKTIIDNAGNSGQLAIDLFVFGYAQGQKALKAEMKKKKVKRV